MILLKSILKIQDSIFNILFKDTVCKILFHLPARVLFYAFYIVVLKLAILSTNYNVFVHGEWRIIDITVVISSAVIIRKQWLLVFDIAAKQFTKQCFISITLQVAACDTTLAPDFSLSLAVADILYMNADFTPFH